MAQFVQESIIFLVRVQCRRKESSRSLSHLLMSFLCCNLIVRIKLSEEEKRQRNEEDRDLF